MAAEAEVKINKFWVLRATGISVPHLVSQILGQSDTIGSRRTNTNFIQNKPFYQGENKNPPLTKRLIIGLTEPHFCKLKPKPVHLFLFLSQFSLVMFNNVYLIFICFYSDSISFS